MTRSELIRILSEKNSELPYNKMEAAVKHVLQMLGSSLKNGERVEIRGFGSFSVRYRGPRRSRNPKTGEYLVALGRFIAHFKAGKELRERVNGGRKE